MFRWEEQNTRRDIVVYRQATPIFVPNYGPSWFDPILPGQAIRRSVRICPDINRDMAGDHLLHWQVAADNAPMRSGAIPLSDIFGSGED